MSQNLRLRRNLPRLVRESEQGIVLIEALIAVLIFSLGILGVIGMQANLIKASAEARYRSEAALVAQKRLDELWTMNLTDRFNATEIDVDVSSESGLPNGRRTTRRRDPDDENCKNNDNCFTVTVNWEQPGTGETRRVRMIGYVTPPP